MTSQDLNYEEILAFGIDLARTVGEEIKTAFNMKKNICEKSCATDLVTETDKKVESMILQAIKEKYPSHKFIGEESVIEGVKCNLTDEPTWIVDPVDGTTNFVHRFPFVAVCLGFCVNKKPTIGVVYNAISNEMFSAISDRGAFCDGVPIHVSNTQELCQSSILSAFGSSRKPDHVDCILANLRAVLISPVHSIQGLGSAALNMCAVAKGQAEAFYEMGIHCWDYCAASVIVQEAGGVNIDTGGGNLDLMARQIIAACNSNIAQSLSSKLKPISFPRD